METGEIDEIGFSLDGIAQTPTSVSTAASEQSDLPFTDAFVYQVDDVEQGFQNTLNINYEPFNTPIVYAIEGSSVPFIQPIHCFEHCTDVNRNCNFLMNEMVQRQSKQNNIMLFNLPESTESDEYSTDMAVIRDIFTFMKLNDIQPIHMYRLGDRAERHVSKPRPVKLIFENRRDIFRIFGEQHLLKNSEKWFRLYFVSDRTQMQRDYIHGLREEIFLRQANGETGLIIKYIRGTPVITYRTY